MSDLRTYGIAAALVAVALFFGSGPGSAKTPDGSPPAEEVVCDGLSGAQFGLCNAYCEAMDCDSDDPHAAPRACERVRAGFQRLSGGADPPCVEDDCAEVFDACLCDAGRAILECLEPCDDISCLALCQDEADARTEECENVLAACLAPF